jgi:hypothetical protein
MWHEVIYWTLTIPLEVRPSTNWGPSGREHPQLRSLASSWLVRLRLAWVCRCRKRTANCWAYFKNAVLLLDSKSNLFPSKTHSLRAAPWHLLVCAGQEEDSSQGSQGSKFHGHRVERFAVFCFLHSSNPVTKLLDAFFDTGFSCLSKNICKLHGGFSSTRFNCGRNGRRK